MSTQDAFLSDTQSDTQRLLAAYLAIEEELRVQAAAARKDNTPSSPESTFEPGLDDSDESIAESSIGWIPRLRAVEGISEGRLGPLHGKLIALGLLKFQLTGRTTGILYRLSPEGRAELKRPAESAPDEGWGEQSAA